MRKRKIVERERERCSERKVGKKGFLDLDLKSAFSG